MNKNALAKKLASRAYLSEKEAISIIENMFEIIIGELKKGEEISIVGFGKFYLYKHAARPVRNPRTQEEMVLKSYKSVKFKPSLLVKNLLKELSYSEEL